MNTRRSAAWAALLLAPTLASAAPPCEVLVVAQGVRNDEGSVGVVVFDSSRGWPEEYPLSFARQATPARAGDVELVFLDLPPGEYALVATHDENGNKQLDRSPSGRPAEGWGMSNNPRARLKTPSFSKAALELGCGDRIEIRLRYRKRKADAASVE